MNATSTDKGNTMKNEMKKAIIDNIKFAQRMAVAAYQRGDIDAAMEWPAFERHFATI